MSVITCCRASSTAPAAIPPPESAGSSGTRSTPRRLVVDLDQWVSESVPPPLNQVPSISGGTLLPSLPGNGFPTNIPNVSYTTTVPTPNTTLPVTTYVAYNGILHTGDLLDFGPQFDKGIISIIPPAMPIAMPYKIFVPKTDADGNDIAGIRVPNVSVPIATYTGWGLRAGNAADPVPIVDGCDATGQLHSVPEHDRAANGNRRPAPVAAGAVWEQRRHQRRLCRQGAGRGAGACRPAPPD